MFDFAFNLKIYGLKIIAQRSRTCQCPLSIAKRQRAKSHSKGFAVLRWVLPQGEKREPVRQQQRK